MTDADTRSAREALERLAGEIARLEVVAEGWDAPHAQTLAAIKSSIEALNAEAFRRLIRRLREDPAAAARLNDAVRDPLIFGVLRFHGLVKDPLEHRVERALEEVRPLIREHGGDVELVAVHVPHTVEVRMTGSCHGCPASSQTLTEGIERAIRKHCPEIEHVRQVSRPPPASSQPVHFVSPFAQAPQQESWIWMCTVGSIPEGGVKRITHWGRNFLLHRQGDAVSCMTNACPHRGMAIDSGKVANGVITCPYHDYEFDLQTGRCLNVREDPLTMHAVRVNDGHVEIRLPL